MLQYYSFDHLAPLLQVAPCSINKIYYIIPDANHPILYKISFSQYGDPNGGGTEERDGGDGDAPVWPEYKAPDWPHLTFNQDDLEVGHDMRARVCTFWQEIVPKFMEDDQTESKDSRLIIIIQFNSCKIKK